jgi:type IV pilus assembly protein PilM
MRLPLRSHSRIGLDLGASAVRAAEVRQDPPTLARVAQVRIAQGSIENGEVRDPEAVAAALEELWEVGHFHGRRVHMGIGNPRVVVREVALPWLADKELRASLPFQVQEHVPIPIEEAVLDYQTVEEFEQDGRRMVRLLLVAAQRSMVLRLVEAVEAAKLMPVGIDIVPFAVMRSVGQVDGLGLAASFGEEAVVDIGSDITSITVHRGGLPRFVRILSSGGRDITDAIARAVPVGDEEAERIKRGESGETGEILQQAEEVVRARTRAFVDEVRSSLDFYSSQAAGPGISRVVLSGGGPRLAGLPQALAEQMDCEVVQGRSFQRVSPEVDMVPEAMASAEPLLAVAVGLALPGEMAG